MSKVLIIEDELAIAELEKDYLELSGFTVEIETDGDAGCEKALAGDYDMFILDLMLPGMDGFEICKRIREVKNTPILMVSAKKEDIDKIRGLGLGADDYITKPFSLAVLRARVNAQLRRSAPAAPGRVELDGFLFDFARLEFFRNGEPIDLSKTEQRLLRLLVENRGRTLPREQLLEQVWDGGEYVDENALSVAVRRLRAKLEDAPIKTVYGVGYTWEVGR